MLKNVIFDFGGVVCAYNPDDILSHFFTDEQREAVKPILYRRWADLDAGTIDYDGYCEETCAMLPDALADRARRFFYGWVDVLPPLEGTWALVGLLKARGYNCYVLSNAPTVFAEKMGRFALLKLMDGVVVSAPLQMSKPHADIFEYTLKKFGLEAGETLFVDDIAANAAGAEAVGLHGYVYDGDWQKLLGHIEALSR